jgi:hypothetical protein
VAVDRKVQSILVCRELAGVDRRDPPRYLAGPNGKPNRALIELRNGLASFIDDYQPDMPQRFQWPRNIET